MKNNPILVPILYPIFILAPLLLYNPLYNCLLTGSHDPLHNWGVLLAYAFIAALSSHYLFTFIHELLHYRAIHKTQIRLNIPRHKIYIQIYLYPFRAGYTYSDTLLELRWMTDRPEVLRAIRGIAHAPHTPIVRMLSLIPASLATLTLKRLLVIGVTQGSMIFIASLTVMLFYLIDLVILHGTDRRHYKTPQTYNITYKITGFFTKPVPIR